MRSRVASDGNAEYLRARHPSALEYLESPLFLVCPARRASKRTLEHTRVQGRTPPVSVRARVRVRVAGLRMLDAIR